MLANMCFYIFMVYGCRSIITHYCFAFARMLYGVILLGSDQTSDEKYSKLPSTVHYTGNYANVVFVQYHVQEA